MDPAKVRDALKFASTMVVGVPVAVVLIVSLFWGPVFLFGGWGILFWLVYIFVACFFAGLS